MNKKQMKINEKQMCTGVKVSIPLIMMDEVITLLTISLSLVDVLDEGVGSVTPQFYKSGRALLTEVKRFTDLPS